MKVYVKIAEARDLCKCPGWMLRGTLTKQDIPVDGEEVLGFLHGKEVGKEDSKKKARCYLANGRYVVFRGEDQSKFYELIV